VRAGEFVLKIERLDRHRSIPVRFETHRGKGSHGTLYYGKRLTVVKDRKKELGSGLVSATLKRSGLRKRDLTSGTIGVMRFEYRFAIRRDARGRYTASFADLSEALTDGATRKEALAEAKDCLEEANAGRIARGEPIPRPRAVRGTRVRVRPQLAVKAALYLGVREKGLGPSALARLLKCDEKEARRLLDPAVPSKLHRLEKALAALGKVLIVEVAEAA
jgi:antitoxin HicB